MTDAESISPSPPNRCTLSSHKNAISVKPNLPRVAVNQDELSHSAASGQVKADEKALQRPKSRQSSAAVPRQCKVKCREDSHALQQPDLMCFNKESTDIPESNMEQGTALQVTSQQPDAFLCMGSAKASENCQGASLEQGTTPTLEKLQYKKNDKSSSVPGPQGLNDPADQIRLGKAQKLRELLKQEMSKERVSNMPFPLKFGVSVTKQCL